MISKYMMQKWGKSKNGRFRKKWAEKNEVNRKINDFEREWSTTSRKKVPCLARLSTTGRITHDVVCLTASFSLRASGGLEIERFEIRLFGQENVPIWVRVFVAEPHKTIISLGIGDARAVSRVTYNVESDSIIKKMLAPLFSAHRSVFQLMIDFRTRETMRPPRGTKLKNWKCVLLPCSTLLYLTSRLFENTC